MTTPPPTDRAADGAALSAEDIADLRTRLATAKHVESRSVEVPVIVLERLIAARTTPPPQEGGSAGEALAAWDRYEPDASTDKVVRQANAMAEAIRAALAQSADWEGK